jgi:hypothetical protein
MNAHANHSSSTALARLTAWVNARWRARRARRLEEETIVCLSAMDSKLINDIGMGIDRLDELTPRTDNRSRPRSRPSRRDKRS